MSSRRFSHVIGFDDAPAVPPEAERVLVVGALFSNSRLEAVLSGSVDRDGDDATQTLIDMVSGSRFEKHLQLIMLQGIAFAGFNVIDIHSLYERLAIPVLVICRRTPDMEAMRRALIQNVSGGEAKWQLIRKAGAMTPLADVFVQRVGIDVDEAAGVIHRLAINSQIPEPLRTAHLVASGIATGESRHRV